MKKSNAFGKALAAVLSYPVYVVFGIVLLVYAFLGNWAEAALLLGILLLSVVIRALYLTFSLFPKREKGAAGKKKGTMEQLRTFSFRLSLASAFCAVPLLVVSLLVDSGAGLSLILSRVLAVMSLGLAVFTGAAGSPLEFTASLQVLPDGDEQPNLTIQSIDAAEKLAGCGQVLILNPLLLYDNTQAVRTVFYAGAQYRGMSLAESPMKTPSEICYLISAFVNAVSSGRALNLQEQREKALDTFVSTRIPERQALSFFMSGFTPCYDRLVSGDICVRVSSDEGAYIAYRATSPDILSLCGYQRTSEGDVKELDVYAEKALREAVASMRSENLVPYIYMTFPGADFPVGNTQRGVLEAVIGVGGVCPSSNADVAETMQDFGVTPLLALPAENETSFGFAQASGICRGEEQICAFSAYSAESQHNERSLAGKTVFLGFPKDELREAVRSVSSERDGLCVIPREASDLTLLHIARTAVAVERRSDAEVLKVSDSTVLPASLKNGQSGLPALFSLLSEACTILCKMSFLRNILLTYGSFLLFVFAIALICGADAILPTASQILLCGSAVSLGAALTVAEDKVMMQNRNALETEKKSIYATCIRCAVLGLFMAIATSLCGMLLFGKTPLAARCFLFSAMVSCGVTVPLTVRLSERRRYGVVGWNWTSAACAGIGVAALLLLSFVRMPSVLFETFGCSSSPWRNFLIALIPAAVPAVYRGGKKLLEMISGKRFSEGF